MPAQALPISTDATILAQIPEKLRSMVDRGLVKLYDDGVLRYTALSGKATGSTAGWLQPTTPLISPASNALQSLQGMTNLMVGLQAVNVAVTAVGFGIVLHKLAGMEQKLNQLDAKMDQVREEIHRLTGVVQEGFQRIKQSVNRQLLAKVSGSIKAVDDLLATGKSLDGGFIISIRAVGEEILGEIHPAMLIGALPHAAMLLECSANVYIAYALAWLGEQEWQQANATMDEASTRLAPLGEELVRRLLGGWPSVYLPLPPEEESLFTLALRSRYPDIVPQQLIRFVRERYPLVKEGRKGDFGHLEIPISLVTDPGVYVTVSDLGPEGNYQRFIGGKSSTIRLAARTAATMAMVRRTRDLVRAMEQAGVSHPLRLRGEACIEGFELIEVPS